MPRALALLCARFSRTCNRYRNFALGQVPVLRIVHFGTRARITRCGTGARTMKQAANRTPQAPAPRCIFTCVSMINTAIVNITPRPSGLLLFSLALRVLALLSLPLTLVCFLPCCRGAAVVLAACLFVCCIYWYYASATMKETRPSECV